METWQAGLNRGFAVNRRLPLEERVTMLPWLWSVLDVNSSPEVFARYDRMTAKELFERSASCALLCVMERANSKCRSPPSHPCLSFLCALFLTILIILLRFVVRFVAVAPFGCSSENLAGTCSDLIGY